MQGEVLVLEQVLEQVLGEEGERHHLSLQPEVVTVMLRQRA